MHLKKQKSAVLVSFLVTVDPNARKYVAAETLSLDLFTFKIHIQFVFVERQQCLKPMADTSQAFSAVPSSPPHLGVLYDFAATFLNKEADRVYEDPRAQRNASYEGHQEVRVVQVPSLPRIYPWADFGVDSVGALIKVVQEEGFGELDGHLLDHGQHVAEVYSGAVLAAEPNHKQYA